MLKLARGEGLTSSVPRGATSFPDTVGVDGRTAAACKRPDCRAFPATGNSADEGSCASTASRCQLVTVFLPKATTVAVIITNASIVGVKNITVPMPDSPARSRRGRHGEERKHCDHEKKGGELLHNDFPFLFGRAVVTKGWFGGRREL